MAKANLPLASWTRFGVLTCPECGANENHISSDEEYTYECKKCQSYTLRPIEESKPMSPSLRTRLVDGQGIYSREEHTVECSTPGCPNTITTKSYSPEIYCDSCRRERQRESNRRYVEKKGAYRRRMTA